MKLWKTIWTRIIFNENLRYETHLARLLMQLLPKYRSTTNCTKSSEIVRTSSSSHLETYEALENNLHYKFFDGNLRYETRLDIYFGGISQSSVVL